MTELYLEGIEHQLKIMNKLKAIELMTKDLTNERIDEIYPGLTLAIEKIFCEDGEIKSLNLTNPSVQAIIDEQDLKRHKNSK